MTVRAFVMLVGVWGIAALLAMTTLGKFLATVAGFAFILIGGFGTMLRVELAAPWIFGLLYLGLAGFLLLRAIMRVRDRDWYEARGYLAGVISMSGIVAVPALALAGLDVGRVVVDVLKGMG